MRDPRQNVRPGEPLRIAAEQINYINSLMRAAGGFSGGEHHRRSFGANTVLVKNESGVIVPRLGVLGIGGVAIDPSNGALEGNDEEDIRARQFADEPLLSGVIPETQKHSERFVVAMEPIAVNAIGVCAVSGVIPVRLFVYDTRHRYATVNNNDTSMLASSGCGAMQLLWMEPTFGASRWALGIM